MTTTAATHDTLFEPLDISYLDHQWVHPMSKQYHGQDIWEIVITFANKTTCHLRVCSTMIDEFHEYKNDDHVAERFEAIKDMTEVCLIEDTWSPGAEQFCFTKLGEVLSEAFEQGDWSLWISPPMDGSKRWVAHG